MLTSPECEVISAAKSLPHHRLQTQFLPMNPDPTVELHNHLWLPTAEKPSIDVTLGCKPFLLLPALRPHFGLSIVKTQSMRSALALSPVSRANSTSAGCSPEGI